MSPWLVLLILLGPPVGVFVYWIYIAYKNKLWPKHANYLLKLSCFLALLPFIWALSMAMFKIESAEYLAKEEISSHVQLAIRLVLLQYQADTKCGSLLTLLAWLILPLLSGLSAALLYKVIFGSNNQPNGNGGM